MFQEFVLDISKKGFKEGERLKNSSLSGSNFMIGDREVSAKTFANSYQPFINMLEDSSLAENLPASSEGMFQSPSGFTYRFNDGVLQQETAVYYDKNNKISKTFKQGGYAKTEFIDVTVGQAKRNDLLSMYPAK